MNKIKTLVMPLMAVSLLASCGSKPVDPLKIDLYKKEIMYDETGKNIDEIDEYEYNDKSLCIKDTKTSPNTPNTKDVYEYAYDEHENETELHYTSYDSEEKTDEGWTINEYTYDKQNRVTKQVTKMSFDHEKWNPFGSYEYEYQENVTIKRSYKGNGSLDHTTTYTYDKKGNLINEKVIHSRNVINPIFLLDWEKVYTVDKNGCATKIEQYKFQSSEEKELTDVAEISYLNNLWYRPLKETTAHYYEGKIDGYSTVEREYDTKNRIKLYKIYEGTEEGATPSYTYYATYEY